MKYTEYPELIASTPPSQIAGELRRGQIFLCSLENNEIIFSAIDTYISNTPLFLLVQEDNVYIALNADAFINKTSGIIIEYRKNNEDEWELYKYVEDLGIGNAIKEVQSRIKSKVRGYHDSQDSQ